MRSDSLNLYSLISQLKQNFTRHEKNHSFHCCGYAADYAAACGKGDEPEDIYYSNITATPN